jgi:hypothetical protein
MTALFADPTEPDKSTSLPATPLPLSILICPVYLSLVRSTRSIHLNKLKQKNIPFGRGSFFTSVVMATMIEHRQIMT